MWDNDRDFLWLAIIVFPFFFNVFKLIFLCVFFGSIYENSFLKLFYVNNLEQTENSEGDPVGQKAVT